MRQGQAHVTGIFAGAEGLPFREFRAIENLADVPGFAELREALQIHQLSRGGRQKGRMRASGNLRDLFQKLDVLGVAAELVISNQCAEGFAPKNAELLFIDFLEHGALIELRGALQVAQDYLLADVRSEEHTSELQS